MARPSGANVREAIERVVKKPPHELLFQLGGALAILLGLVAVVVQLSQGIGGRGQPSLATVVVTLLVDIILGAILALAAVVTRKNLVNGAILGGAVGLVLALYGGTAGLIGGVLGIIGAIVAFVGPYLPRIQRA